MKFKLNTVVGAVAAALLGMPLLGLAQSSAPLRSYAIAGTETSRYYDSTRGWIVSTQAFTGTLDLVTTTDAQLTKVYPDGSTVVRSLVLQWVVDLNAPAQSGAAAEIPDPTDPVIKRTTYVIGLQFDGTRYTASATFRTLAYMSVIPGIYDWFVVAYGDFSGFVISPLGTYAISGSDLSGKTTASYTGTLTLSSPTSGVLVKVYAGGATSTVHLDFPAAIDLSAANQTVSAIQVENQSNQLTTYTVTLQLNGAWFGVNAASTTTQTKGRTTRAVGTGTFSGSQP